MISNNISQVRGRAGGLARSDRKRVANIAKMEQAKADGLLTGRPSLGCNCGRVVHASSCRVVMAQRKRESRARLQDRTEPPQPRVVMPPKENMDWLLDGLAPRRPEKVGRNCKGNKKRKLFVDRQLLYICV